MASMVWYDHAPPTIFQYCSYSYNNFKLNIFFFLVPGSNDTFQIIYAQDTPTILIQQLDTASISY